MPWTLWRYTFIEIWRVVLICTAILVSVISFAAAAKPLAEGALSPLGAIRFMILAIPPMLAYALPFAAGFGASLVYHRMAQDNETVAAHSGGVSHRSVLVPALVSGLLLASTVVGLNEWIIPRFLHAMQRMITLDVAQIMIRQIDRGQAAELNNVMIYANRIDEVDPPPNSSAKQIFRMLRVSLIQLDDSRNVVGDATVQRAWIILSQDPSDETTTLCRISIEDGVGMRSDGGLVKIGSKHFQPIAVPSAFEDDPKFLSFGELRRLEHDPDEMGFVDARRIVLAEGLALADLPSAIDRELAESGRLKLVGPGGGRYEIAADKVEPHDSGAWLISRGDRPVEVRLYERDDSGELRVSTASAGETWLRVDSGDGGSDAIWNADEQGPTLRFTLQLIDVRIEKENGETTQREQRDLRDLRLLSDPLARFAAESSGELLAEADAREQADASPAFATDAASQLRATVSDLEREIVSKQHERMALASSSFIMLVLGAISALLHRDSLPLVVYLWSFFPALVMILLISSGQQETHGHSVASGLPILWSGVAAGGLVALISFVKLARH
ncbi:MAG: LptF/LptG family permease [Phycisphaeraceae bacterium]|nr:MAG: LptF/LptG family permease [Phycisphaeraceae bacterium]